MAPSLRLGLLAGLVCCLSLAATASGQVCPPISGLPSTVPPVPVKPPPRPGEAIGLIEGLSTNDAVIEIIFGQSRLITLREPLRTPDGAVGSVAVSDPGVADFNILPPPPKQHPRQLRLIGQRIGVTDLVITLPDGKVHAYEVRVVADLDVLRVQLQCLFPDASLRLMQMRDNIIVEGQARSTAQVARIMETIRAYLASVQSTELRSAVGPLGEPPPPPDKDPGKPPKPPDGGALEQVRYQPPTFQEQGPPIRAEVNAGPEFGRALAAQITGGQPRVINLIRVPTTQQVLLKVRVAELNRTATRQIGADFLALDESSGAILGTALGNSNILAQGNFGSNQFTASATSATIPGQTTAFAIFEKGNFDLMITALRRNQLLRILAEPNLVALNGQRANFLAGGQFFIPVAQSSSDITGGGGGISAQPVNFGVSLDFLAQILEDDVIRLTVDPSVSQPDFSVATTFVAGGSPVPGLNTRQAHTTVEMRPGQTLAIAGLLQVTLDGTTNRIPGLGDLPILGPFFSNTTGGRTEKELIILVTPYLVEPMNPDQVPPTPGDEIKTPTDLEFYLLNRIEGRTGRDYRATTEYDDALHVLRCYLRLHDQRVRGPHGYCE
jgi:pilus assembly protein CpaC